MLNSLLSCPVLIAALMSNGADPLPPGPPAGSFAPQFVGQDVDDKLDVGPNTLTDWVTTRSPFAKRRDRAPTKFAPRGFDGCLQTYLQRPDAFGEMPTIIIHDPACHDEYEVITVQRKSRQEDSILAAPESAAFTKYCGGDTCVEFGFEMVRRIHRPSPVYRSERIEPERRGETHPGYVF